VFCCAVICMPCHAVLRCAMPCHAVLCYAVMHQSVAHMCCAVLCCAACCARPEYTKWQQGRHTFKATLSANSMTPWRPGSSVSLLICAFSTSTSDARYDVSLWRDTLPPVHHNAVDDANGIIMFKTTCRVTDLCQHRYLTCKQYLGNVL